MSRPDHSEFDQLLRAHTGRTLTLDEDARMRRLAAGDPVAAADLGAIDELHDLLDDERALFAAASAPLTAGEEADEGFARLAQVAARGEVELRDTLRAMPSAIDVRRPRARRTGLWLALAAAAAAIVLVVVRGGSHGPALLDNRPDDSVLGGAARIVMESELRGDRPELSWHPVLGAVRYEARIVDGVGGAVLVRPDSLAALPRWILSAEDFVRVRSLAVGAALRLRVVARDGSGIAIGTTGDLPLRIVD